jgi:coproporphyrinogen dehydrogenase HemZ
VCSRVCKEICQLSGNLELQKRDLRCKVGSKPKSAEGGFVVSYTKQEVLDFVKENDVKFVRLAFCDLLGRQKNISIMAEELPRAFAEGISFDASAIRGLADVSRSDLLLVPEPETLHLLPWRPAQGRVIRFFCQIKYPDYSPYPGDSRGLLQTVTRRLRDLGFSAQIGTECEFYLFKTDQDGYPTKTTHGHLKKEFLPALFFELEAMKSFFESNHLTVKSIYIGGGTPTSLTATELAEVLARLPETDELTVEAGRPDTIDQDKLEIFNKAGVDRVSVNPQTLNEKTLRLIGRDHTVEQFFAAVEEVRKANIPILNVDLIAGLPGENAGDMQDTVERIMELQPENVTVHTLALKRASSWYKDFKKWPLPSSKVTERMVEEAQTRLFSSGLLPYYMYRQREMAANLENIGYAKAGAECYYNIVMIEELQTVVGVGAGATTRFVGETISRVVNPKCPSTYAKRVDELIREKREYLAQLLGLVN